MRTFSVYTASLFSYLTTLPSLPMINRGGTRASASASCCASHGAIAASVIARVLEERVNDCDVTEIWQR